MPNWAYGPVTITGTRQNISRFVSRFIFDEDRKVGSKRKHFFARSFTGERKETTMLEIRIQFQGRSKDAVDFFCLPIDFAWSAVSCLVDGYPQSCPECMTLADACMRDRVSVEILTEEGGMCFEEHITCDAQGNLTSTCLDLVEYECQNCHSTSYIASFNDLDEYPCDECGESEWKQAVSEDRQNESSI